ncbi:MAG TPA: phospholipase D-like domain-containing protein [Polyangiaceae bacterium]
MQLLGIHEISKPQEFPGRDRNRAELEGLELLDGGGQAYPRMLQVIAAARRHIYLEVYSFAYDATGKQFVTALANAAHRDVEVHVVIDGWGSAFSGRSVAAELRAAGCHVKIYNRLRSLLAGRFARTHRKMLLVDDAIAFIGGINIGDENTEASGRVGWADLALELRGAPCAYLGKLFRGEPRGQLGNDLEIHFSRLGEGWRLRRLYLRAIARAHAHVHIAHGYFLPDRGILRAIVSAARRGVHVQLVLAGRSDVPLARAATRSLYRRLLRAGVAIYEWNGSVLHAKLACIDSNSLLIGSFNLDPFSLTNREVLVQVSRPEVVKQGEEWIADRLLESHAVTTVELGTTVQRWLLDPIGLLVVRIAVLVSRLLAPGRQRRNWRKKSKRRSPARVSERASSNADL